MPTESVAFAAFNRGIISPLALARSDLKRLAFAAQNMTNWMPRVFGSMMLRPGWEYLGSTLSDARAYFIDFIFSTADKALIEITDSNMRIWISDAVMTRPSVSSAVSNGDFTTDLTGWTDSDESGGVSAWVTGGYMGLTGNGTAAAIRRQTVTVAAADQGIEHALRVIVQRGPVTLRVGSTSGGDEYITETSLATGTHSLTLTPTGASFFIQFHSRLKRQVLVNSCNVESSGAVTITAPWVAADLDNITYDQSGDIVYVACSGYQQRKIERRTTRSWSIVIYQPEDGPFMPINTGPITITPSALSGNITLTASAALFRSTHVGALFEIISSGQSVSADVTAENQFTNAIRVTGVDSQRVFTIVRAGTWTATVTLQRSLTSETGPWEDVTTYTTNATITFDDSLDNQIAWYRIGVKTGGFTSGTVELDLTYTIGSVDGIVRITDFSSATSVSAEVIVDLGGTAATDDWSEGEWSSFRGYPTAVAFAEGRLTWSGKDGFWASVSDDFESFDEEVVGDSGPIARTIGSGPVDRINWILALQRLILGAQGAEFSCKSSSLDEPITPTTLSIKPASTQGSASVCAEKIDKVGIYIQRGGTRVMQIALEDDGEYGSSDLTQLCPEVTQPNVLRMAVQRQPDTRIHCIRSDGVVAVAVFEKIENVLCWSLVETDGVVEDVVILPGAVGDSEDAVYYVVQRTINGSTKRCFERWALESECVGGTLNKQADSFFEYSGASTTTITGLSHLEGESVVVWGGGKDLGSYTVSGGQISGLTEAVTSAIVGLTYTAQWKSSKLAYSSSQGTALTQKKKIPYLGVIMQNTHYQGLKYGANFSDLYDLPAKKDEATIAADTVHSTYDEEPFVFPGSWDSDSRLCLQAQAPRSCTLLCAVIPVETNDKY
jgi:hypothetical protein